MCFSVFCNIKPLNLHRTLKVAVQNLLNIGKTILKNSQVISLKQKRRNITKCYYFGSVNVCNDFT